MPPEVRVRPHVRRQFASRRIVSPLGCDLPAFGANEHGVEFERADWAEFRRRYGFNEKRRRLLNNLAEYLVQHRDAGIGIKEISIYGSFVSDKPDPGDIDVAIWREPGGNQDRVWTNNEAYAHGIDSFSVVGRQHYCGWIGKPRERGSKHVIRVIL